MNNDIYLEQGQIVDADGKYLYIKSYMRINCIYRADREADYKAGDVLLFAVLLDGSIAILKRIREG